MWLATDKRKQCCIKQAGLLLYHCQWHRRSSKTL